MQIYYAYKNFFNPTIFCLSSNSIDRIVAKAISATLITHILCALTLTLNEVKGKIILK